MRRVILKAVSVALAVAVVLAFLLYFGVIHLNNPSKNDYPIRGIDVSAYQGEIDWQVLSENISFAFIKATEGSSFVDSRFQYNFEQAQDTNLRVGVYHFFSFESSGAMQAEHFIRTVGSLSGMLPTAVDVEFYKSGGVQFAEDEIIAELTDFIAIISDYYSVAPIIYATQESYDTFISGHFEDCPLWIRNVVTKPSIKDGREWTLWQFSNRHHLRGYSGAERFVDMNVFSGDEGQWLRFCL
ncbi:glycoside hydrolase family 25 [Clostridia bacterium]|nr:glycoside hydrolase family 25 [Clostridia bacterium]